MRSLINVDVFLLVIVIIWAAICTAKTSAKCAPLSPKHFKRAEQAARQWAPLVWLAPGEKYFPSSALDFLVHTGIRSAGGDHKASDGQGLPSGVESRNLYLETAEDLSTLLANSSSFLHGHSPLFFSVPVYAVVNTCCPRYKPLKSALAQPGENEVIKSPSLSPEWRHENTSTVKKQDAGFEVTYWLFFPFSEGKRVCTVNAGALGPIPIPWLRTACLGQVRKYGDHVGDWEHVTIAFKGSGEPAAMYVSTHDAGALYSPSRGARGKSSAMWTYSGHELRRGARLQNPRFPRRAVMLSSGRPILFAAKGSHGLWTQPGRHKYVTFPNLEDETGFGSAWQTWQNLQIISWPPSTTSHPQWLKFEGHWGNPKSGCHPLSQNVCQVSDGPQGIPTKKHAFRCLTNTLPHILATKFKDSPIKNIDIRNKKY